MSDIDCTGWTVQWTKVATTFSSHYAAPTMAFEELDTLGVSKGAVRTLQQALRLFLNIYPNINSQNKRDFKLFAQKFAEAPPMSEFSAEEWVDISMTTVLRSYVPWRIHMLILATFAQSSFAELFEAAVAGEELAAVLLRAVHLATVMRKATLNEKQVREFSSIFSSEWTAPAVP